MKKITNILDCVAEIKEIEKNSGCISRQVGCLILSKDLKRDGKIIDKIVTKERVDDEYLNVKVVFVVEQNIVSDEVVEY